MNFANPILLWLTLALLPALLAFLWWAWRQRQQLMAEFVQSRLLANLTVGVSRARQKTRLGLVVAGILLIGIALARPQWGFTWEEAKQRGLDIVVAIDTSRSMLAPDVAPNRLARAKLAALDLMQEAKSDRLGLVAFAGTAFLQCPLTLDEEAFRQSVAALDVNIIPQGGSSLEAAIREAMNAFKKEEDSYKVLVLFTDGEDHEEGAVEAAKEAAENGMRIYTVGIGTAEGELLRVKDAKGNEGFVKDDDGNVVKSRLNESLLREIAGATEGGFYLPLRGATTIDTLYNHEHGLNSLPKSESTTKLVKRFHERFQWPLALGILLLMIEMFLPERKRATAPAAKVRRELVTASAAVTLALLAIAPSAMASPATARQQLEKSDFNGAIQEYDKLLEKSPDDARLHYNRGAAAYRAKDFADATKSFENALRSPDLNLQQQSYYNLGNSLFRLGSTLQEPQQTMGAWEKSIENYERALKLNAQDADAKHNLELVRKKLEELKKQQQQQQDQKPDDQKKDEQEKKDPHDQQKQDQQKKDDQSKQQEKQEQEKKQQADKGKDKKKGEQKQDNAQKQNQPDKTKNDGQEAQNQQNPKGSDKQSDKQQGQKDEQAQASAQPNQMTLQQVKQLLDAQKGEERVMLFRPSDPKDDGKKRYLKNW